MKFATIAVLLSAAISSMAYSVITPTNTTVWTAHSPQKVTWDRVDSDPARFTISLHNENRVILAKDQILAENVDGNLKAIEVSPPPGGFPTGSGFRIKLVAKPEDTNTIFSQSPEFTIKP